MREIVKMMLCFFASIGWAMAIQKMDSQLGGVAIHCLSAVVAARLCGYIFCHKASDSAIPATACRRPTAVIAMLNWPIGDRSFASLTRSVKGTGS